MASPNVYAPPAYNGQNQNPHNQSVEVMFDYVYDVTLSGNQFLRDQIVAIQNDADFSCRAVKVSYNTGIFSVRFSDSQGYYFSNGMLNSGNFFAGGVPIEFPIFPSVTFPSGGKIGIDIQDLSGSSNTIELLFRGIKIYRVPRQ